MLGRLKVILPTKALLNGKVTQRTGGQTGITYVLMARAAPNNYQYAG